jgi:hypothetical protein
MSQHTTPSGRTPYSQPVDFSERFGPAVDEALDARNASAVIRDAMAAALETHADLVAQPDCDTPSPPAPEVADGDLGAPRFCRCEQALREDFRTLVAQGYADNLGHGVRRAVRAHLEIETGGDA